MTRALSEIPFYISLPHPCSYLPGNTARSLFVDPNGPLDTHEYSRLAELGFRRSGRLVYRPHCADCSQCLAARIPVAEFNARRSQRRTAQRNADLRIEVHPAHQDDTHYRLYQRYTATRHGDGDGNMADASAQEYWAFLTADWSDTRFIEFHLADQLVAVAVTDWLDDGLSALYTFFEPDLASRALGVQAILSQVQLARELGLDYLYLGYWIADCRKMRYKADWRPLEVFQGQGWTSLTAADYRQRGTARGSCPQP